MRKIILFSIFLLVGLVMSQTLPNIISQEDYTVLQKVFNIMLFTSLAYIMINVGREFEIDKTRLGDYTKDYFIAMATAAFPWIFVAVYYMFLLPPEYMGNAQAWNENLLLSRFAAPTSAGILFTMLAAAGLKNKWIYKKTQILAIFDDLDTILLMIPLQMLMIGFKLELVVIVLIIFILLVVGWKKLGMYNFDQNWSSILLYSIFIVAAIEIIYSSSKSILGEDSGIHIEVLLPAFVLGMVMKAKHYENSTTQKVSTYISFIFMFLVGISTPLFINGLEIPEFTDKITAQQPLMDWDMLIFHVIMVTIISNIGKMFPIFFYRDRNILERLALSVGMFARGEVGAGIIIIAMGYNLGGPALIISILSLVLNLLLTGVFIVIVKKLTQKVYAKEEEEAAKAAKAGNMKEVNV